MRVLVSLVVMTVLVSPTLPAQEPKKGDAGGAPPRLGAMDKNGDGKVSREEFTGSPEVFGRLDADRDGFITRAESGARGGAGAKKGSAPVPPARSSTGLVPLIDLKTERYKGKEGGLYPGGSNERPTTHEEAGLRLARSIRPLDEQGRPAADGKVVLLAIGMSNTTMEFAAFKKMGDAEPGKDPRLVIVDGAVSGMTTPVISQPASPRGKKYWDTVDERLAAAGVTRAQVQAIWLKEADAMPSAPNFPDYAVTLEEELILVAHLLRERFPNLRLCYNSSRIYGGHATTALNPEPYAYESGFSVKWLIEKQIEGDPELNYDPARRPVKAPWLAWGPYIWADGIKPGSSGLTYERADLRENDGTHPAAGAQRKVARLLLEFFKTDSTARIWFLTPTTP